MNMRAPRWIQDSLRAAALALCAACGDGSTTADDPGASAEGTKAPPPNVLLVVIDTLRADHVGANGYARATTPRLDRLGAGGTVFTQAVAQSSWTRPSMATLMTGLHPTSVGLTCHNFRVPQGGCDVLPEAAPTLAEELGAAGWATAGVIANINVDPVFGFHQGFDHYVSIPKLLAPEGDAEWRHGNDWLRESTRAVTDHGLEWLEGRAPDEPFLLYLHYLDPHAPYEPPAHIEGSFAASDYGRDAETNTLLARYDGEIRFVDEELGRVLDRMEADGILADTVVVVVSDHGEEFLDHGGLEHGWTMYDEQVRVPLVVAAPGFAPSRVEDQVRVLDVLPTVLDLCGLAIPDWAEGVSLVPHLAGEALEVPPAVSEHGYNPISSYRAPPWKLLIHHGTDAEVLYDLAADPGETTDVAAAHPDVVRRLRTEFDALRRRTEAASELFAGDDSPIDLTPEQIRQLEAIGYTDGD